MISRENGVCGSLLLLASTGDRTIQALLENQVQIILYQVESGFIFIALAAGLAVNVGDF